MPDYTTDPQPYSYADAWTRRVPAQGRTNGAALSEYQTKDCGGMTMTDEELLKVAITTLELGVMQSAKVTLASEHCRVLRAEIERLQKEMEAIVSLDELMVEKCQQIKAENKRLKDELTPKCTCPHCRGDDGNYYETEGNE